MKEVFEIAECTLLTAITMEGLNIWLSFPLLTIIQIQLCPYTIFDLKILFRAVPVLAPGMPLLKIRYGKE